MNYITKSMFILLGMFSLGASVSAQESTPINPEVNKCEATCIRTQKTLDSAIRYFDYTKSKLTDQVANHKLALEESKVNFQSSIDSAHQRAADAEARCRYSYDKSKESIDRCWDGLLNKLLGTGVCDYREDISKDRYNMCLRSAEESLKSTLSKNKSSNQSRIEKMKLRLESYKKSYEVRLARYKDRLDQAKVKHAACNKC